MEMTIVLILGYIMFIGLLYVPKCPKAIETMKDEAKTKKKKRAKYTDPNQLILNFDDTKMKKRNDYAGKTIRDLKKLASQAKIKRYSYLTKAQLIQALERIDMATA